MRNLLIGLDGTIRLKSPEAETLVLRPSSQISLAGIDKCTPTRKTRHTATINVEDPGKSARQFDRHISFPRQLYDAVSV